MAITRKFSLFGIAMIWLAAGYAQPLDKAKLDQLFDRLDEKNKAMGSLLISKDGKDTYNRTIGYAAVKGTERIPLKADTRYRIGSVTKMFTATMIFQLIEEKRLSLTDTLGKFYPQIPNAGKISIGQLLGHRSGIPDLIDNGTFKTMRTSGAGKDEILVMIAKSKPDFEPGAKYEYSNSNYSLLGMIVEKLTGKSYEKALKDRITSRIGLKDTYVGTGAIDIGKNECYSYKYVTDWEQQPETHPSLLFGSGSLISTTKDLARFIEALFSLKLVSQQSLDLMTLQESGLAKFTYNGKTLYGHTGGIDGFGAWLMYLPEEKLTVSYATNGKVYPVGELIDGIVNIYNNKPFVIPGFETLSISNETLDLYTGIYSIPEAPVKFTVSRENTTLLLQMNGRPAAPLEAVEPNKFKIEAVGMTIVFDVAKKQMTIIRDGRERVLTKEN